MLYKPIGFSIAIPLTGRWLDIESPSKPSKGTEIAPYGVAIKIADTYLERLLTSAAIRYSQAMGTATKRYAQAFTAQSLRRKPQATRDHARQQPLYDLLSSAAEFQ